MDERTKILTGRLQEWFNGGYAGPYKIQINPTNKCNLNCLSCVARGKAVYNNSMEVSTERYIQLVKEAKELGVLYCDICGGGEPFARAETTLSIMQELKKQKITGSVMTNGTLFSEESIKKLVEIEWDFVNLSIDGANAKINNSLRGVGAFEKNVKAINLFNFWKGKFKKGTPRLSIYSVINKKNYEHISNLLDFVIKYQIDGLYLQPIVVSKEKGRELVMDEENLSFFKKILGELKPKFLENKINSNIDFIDSGLTKFSKIKNGKNSNPCRGVVSCYAPWLMVVIRADGIAGLCPPSVEFINGTNIKDYNLKEIWTSNVFNEFRKKIIEDKKPLCCNNCGSMETIANMEIVNRINKKI